jgi:hypothetical protein
LNQIRTWVRQGRTDAWIAHQLDVSVPDIRAFKREHDLAPDAANDGDDASGGDEPDLRAEDDALVAAALEAEEEEAPEPDEDAGGEEEPEGDQEESGQRRRRRGRRGGRGRRRRKALEGTFDHGEDGYGLWLDPAIQDDPVYAEHWAGHRPVVISVEAERIVITRAGEDAVDSNDEDS